MKNRLHPASCLAGNHKTKNIWNASFFYWVPSPCSRPPAVFSRATEAVVNIATMTITAAMATTAVMASIESTQNIAATLNPESPSECMTTKRRGILAAGLITLAWRARKLLVGTRSTASPYSSAPNLNPHPRVLTSASMHSVPSVPTWPSEQPAWA